MCENTTLYLPADLNAAVKREAKAPRVSETEVIPGIVTGDRGSTAASPTGALFASGAPIAREADEHLAGFGER